MEKELNIMCNLSEGIAEEAWKEGHKAAWDEANKLKEGIAEEASEKAIEQTLLKNLRSIIKKAKVSVEEAMEMLEIPSTDRTKYSKLLAN